MPLRPLTISILIFIFVIIGIYEIYERTSTKETYYRFTPNQGWVGVIDMDFDHGIDMDGILHGDDAALMIDNNNVLFQQLTQKTLKARPLTTLNDFELGDYDSNGDGLINAEDPIYSFLYVITFSPESPGYNIRSLNASGIRAIKVKHMTPYGDHEVILSDGSTRTLYEIHKSGGTAIYRNMQTQTITHLPEPSTGQ